MELLKEILTSVPGDASHLDELSELVLACMNNAHEPVEDAEHAEYVRRAHQSALAGQWDRARRLLQHTKEDTLVSTPWPKYPLPPDPREAWKLLKEITYRAHLDPDLDSTLRNQIFTLAFKCAANAHTNLHEEAEPPDPPTDYDQHILRALERAKDKLWDLVRDELNHD